MKDKLETIIEGKSIQELIADTRDVSMSYFNMDRTGNPKDYILQWRKDSFAPYKNKYNLNEVDATFNIVKYMVNNLN